MQFNFNELAPLQAILDDKICLNHDVKADDTIKKRILALMVEVGELANETRCFKYWSLKEASERTIILEEYVDGIHFLVSLCNNLNLKPNFEVDVIKEDLTTAFIAIYNLSSILSNDFNIENASKLFKQYLNLGYNLGFNEQDIINAYFLKNEENHQRQASGY